jgi:hypothetical protein
MAPPGAQALQSQQNLSAMQVQLPQQQQQLSSALSSNHLPTIDESMRIGMSMPGMQARHQLPSLSNPFMDVLHLPPQGLQRVLPGPSSILPSSFNGGPVGFDRVGVRTGLPVSAPNPLQPMYPLHSGGWPSSASNVGLPVGAQPSPVLLPALNLALHGQHPLHAAPERAADDGHSGPTDDLSEDDAPAAGPNAARRSRGRPRGAKDKQPRVKRLPASAAAPPGEDGWKEEGEGEGRDDGRGRPPDDPPSPRSERRPARRNRPEEPAAARGEGSDGPAAGGAGGEGYGRRKPWKIVLSAQDALDIYRCTSCTAAGHVLHSRPEHTSLYTPPASAPPLRRPTPPARGLRACVLACGGGGG